MSNAKPINGKNFYRLNQVDKNGKSNYSTIVNADFTSVSGIRIYPDPATDVLNIAGLSNSSATTISIINVEGKIVLQKNISGNFYQLNIQSLRPGNYFIKTEDSKKITTIKFVKE